LLVKFLEYGQERLALARQLLPAWKGQTIPVTEAKQLAAHLAKQPMRVRRTLLGKRAAGVVDFVASRGSANQLDDHIRSLSDQDVMNQDASYGLLRLITWATPILGFLGTVLGIAEAVAGVTPDRLEKNLSDVTDGLALAFDTTALALGLTMILMFLTFVMERLEQSVLEQVDAWVDEELAHRFERTGPESGQFIEALRNNTQILLAATEQLVEKQAGLWVRTLEKADRHWVEAGQKQQAQMTAALHAALESTLDRHAKRQVGLEDQLQQRGAALVEAVTRLGEQVAQQAQVLARVQEGEAHLVRLQETMQQNLQILSGSGAFEEAVQSLTAAIHLLTAKAAPGVSLPGKKAA